jgi:hypothetical protein
MLPSVLHLANRICFDWGRQSTARPPGSVFPIDLEPPYRADLPRTNACSPIRTSPVWAYCTLEKIRGFSDNSGNFAHLPALEKTIRMSCISTFGMSLLKQSESCPFSKVCSTNSMGRSSTGVVAWYWRIGSRCAGVPREKDNLAIYPRGAGRSRKTPEFPSGAAVYWAWMIIRPEVTPLQLVVTLIVNELGSARSRQAVGSGISNPADL